MWKPLLPLIFAAVAFAQSPPPATQPAEPDVGRAIYRGDELLKPYTPQSTVVTPANPVPRPKFPAIDIHCHWALQQSPEFLIEQMDKLGVSHAVNLSGGHGRSLEAMLNRFGKHDRLITFANLDFSDIDAPQWPERQVDALRRAKTLGVRGLKIFKSLGLTEKDAAGNTIAVDDPRLDPIWAVCSELQLPVLIHSADPVAFFQPIDANNERAMQLMRHPSWSFFGPQFPSWDVVIEQRNRVIERHPQTQFIVAHMAEAGNDLQRLSQWLERYPNMHVDISGRENEIGRTPFSSRRFFIKHADRILFGTDRYPGRPDQPRYTIYYRMLETDDEYFDYYDHPFPPTGEWKIYGLNLPDDVLEKIYRTNARKLLGLDREANR